MKTKTMKIAAFVMAAAVVSPSALAATDTSDLTVTASIAGSCSVTTPNTLAFGAYDPVTTHATTALDGQADISVTCTQGTTGAIGLGNGLNYDALNTRRQMAVGTERLYYFLYTTSARTTEWTDASTVTHTGSGAAQSHTVFGRVPAAQTGANAGSYTDTVVVTVTFTP